MPDYVYAEFLNDGLTIDAQVWRVGAVGKFRDEGKTGALIRLTEAEQMARWQRPMFRQITEEDYAGIANGTVPRIEEGWTPPRKRPVMPARPVANEEAGDLSPEGGDSGRVLQVPPSAPEPAPQPQPEPTVTATPPAPVQAAPVQQVGLSAPPLEPQPEVLLPAQPEIPVLADVALQTPAMAAAPVLAPADPIQAAVDATRAAAEAAGQDADKAEAALRKALAPTKKRAPRKAAAAVTPVEGQTELPEGGTAEEEALLAEVKAAVEGTPQVTQTTVPQEETYLPGMTTTEVQTPQADEDHSPTAVLPADATRPYDGYDNDSTSATLDVLARMSAEELANFLVYEYANRNRPAIIGAIESSL